MFENQHSTPLPPHVQLIQMSTAYWISRVVHVAATLNLADHLAAGAKTAEELATPTGTHPPSLYRLMRTLASLGLLTEAADQSFSLAPVGAALQSGAPGSGRATVLTMGGEWASRGMDNLLYSVQTGKSGVEKALGMPVFDWLAEHPVEASLFSETMVGFHGGEPPAIAAAYDFSSFKTVVDVGGATGNLLGTVLGAYAQPAGILFDLPHVVAEAAAKIAAKGLTNRITIQEGSFFEHVPVGGNAYLLSHVIHDWSEDQCLTILANCKRAMNPDGRILIIEMVLPTGDTPHPGKMLDIMMLVGPGGRERTEAEYGALLAKAGFQLNRVIPTQSAVSIVEATLA